MQVGFLNTYCWFVVNNEYRTYSITKKRDGGAATTRWGVVGRGVGATGLVHRPRDNKKEINACKVPSHEKK